MDPRSLRRRAAALVGAVLAASVAAVPVPAAGSTTGAPVTIDGGQAIGTGTRLLVGVDAATGALPAAVHARAATRAVGRAERLGIEVVEVAAGADVSDAMAALRATPGVRAVERDSRVTAASPPRDQHYDHQWNLHPASASNRGTASWEAVHPTHRGEGVVVAVVDSGFRLGGVDEPEIVLAGERRLSKPHASCPSRTWDDDYGHGTHVAGTIAQRTGGRARLDTTRADVAGIAPRAAILPVKVLDCLGDGLISDVVLGIDAAVSRGAHVINLSLGGAQASTLVCEAVARAAASAVVVASTGNAGASTVFWPAACPGALAVGAVRYDGATPHYANRGCRTSLAAPGGDLDVDQFRRGAQPVLLDDGILQETLDPADRTKHQHRFLEGTSMAAAHVSGAAALLRGARPDAPPAAVSRALLASARDVGAAGPDHASGWGALDIAGAVATLPTAIARGETLLPLRGYRMVASDGGVFAHGACFEGSTGGVALRAPIVGATGAPGSTGYWLVASDGGVFSFPVGAANPGFFGSTGGQRLNKPIVAMAATPSGRGYWLVASDGGVFAFGHAGFHGSTGGIPLQRPIVAISATPSGGGYRLVASDGGVFAFGDATFHGSTGGRALNEPIVAAAGTPSGRGYWLVARDGGVFAFGDASFHGSTGGIRLNAPITAAVATPSGGGYLLGATDGGVFAFGDAPFRGSVGGTPLNRPIVAMSAAPDPLR